VSPLRADDPSGYTVNVGGWSSLAMVDERYAVDGTEVTGVACRED
jgi:hypothetical protein